MEQDRPQGDAEGAADRAVVRRRCAAGNFDVAVEGNCHERRQPAARRRQIPAAHGRMQNYGNYEDPKEVEIYNKMLHETDTAKQRQLMRQFEKHVLDDRGAHDSAAVVVPDRAAPVLCEGLEDQPEPLRQPGPGERSGSTSSGGAARPAALPCLRRQAGVSTCRELALTTLPLIIDRPRANERWEETMRSGLRGLRGGARRVLALSRRAGDGRGDAEARRHADLSDPGRRAADLRRPSRGDLRDGARDGAVLQRADPDQPGQPRPRPPISSAISAPRCRSRPTAARPTPSRSATGVKFHDGTPLTAADVAASCR